MTIYEYQAAAARTMNPKLDKRETELHALHGISGETGEIHSIFQKAYQGHAIDEGELMKEVGDLMWMIAELCTVEGWELDTVCKMNIEKLRQRYPEGFTTERSLHREE